MRNPLTKEALADALENWTPACPWNPFPHDSEWGRKVEEAYQLEQKRRALAARLRTGEG